MDIGNNVLSVNVQRGGGREPQTGVENGAVLSDVDVFSAEHCFSPCTQVALFGELKQQGNRVLVDPLLRVVKEESRTFGCEVLRSRRLLFEEVAKVSLTDLIVVRA